MKTKVREIITYTILGIQEGLKPPVTLETEESMRNAMQLAKRLKADKLWLRVVVTGWSNTRGQLGQLGEA